MITLEKHMTGASQLTSLLISTALFSSPVGLVFSFSRKRSKKRCSASQKTTVQPTLSEAEPWGGWGLAPKRTKQWHKENEDNSQ
jgi:hypothetical protein